jgi:hypothetical protein
VTKLFADLADVTDLPAETRRQKAITALSGS